MKNKEEIKEDEEVVNANIDYTDVMRNKTAYLTDKEIKKMLKYCLRRDNFTKNKLMHYMLILLLSRTGRRVSEIVGKRPYTTYHGLRPVDIHPEGNLIEWGILKKRPIRARVSPRGKKRSESTLSKMKDLKVPKNNLKPIDAWTLSVLKKYIEANRIGLYDRVIPVTRQGAWFIIKTIAEKIGIGRDGFKVHPHMFRHGFSINFLKKNPYDAGALIKLQRLLDHSDIAITQGYAQFTPEDLRDALEKVFKEDN